MKIRSILGALALLLLGSVAAQAQIVSGGGGWNGGEVTNSICGPNGSATDPTYGFCSVAEMGIYRASQFMILRTNNGFPRTQFFLSGSEEVGAIDEGRISMATYDTAGRFGGLIYDSDDGAVLPDIWVFQANSSDHLYLGQSLFDLNLDDGVTENMQFWLDATTQQILLDADIDDSGNGTITLSAPGGTNVYANDLVGNLSTLTMTTAQASMVAQNAASVYTGVTAVPGTYLNLEYGSLADVQQILVANQAITVNADADGGGNGTVTIEAANSASQVVVDSTGVSVTNYFFLDSVLFAALGAPANGAMVYCSDCDPAAAVHATCTSAGAQTGAVATRVGGAWICN